MTDSEKPRKYYPPWESYRGRYALTDAEIRTITISVLGNVASVLVIGAAVLFSQNTSVAGTLMTMAVALGAARVGTIRPVAAWLSRTPARRDNRNQLVMLADAWIVVAVLALLGHAVGLGK